MGTLSTTVITTRPTQIYRLERVTGFASGWRAIDSTTEERVSPTFIGSPAQGVRAWMRLNHPEYQEGD